MLKTIYIAGMICLPCVAYADSASTAAPIHVTVNSEVRELAEGYARASAKLTRPPVSLAFQREGVLRVLEDVKSVRDSEGILVVEIGKGLTYLINPKDVVYITDGRLVAPKS